MPNQIQVQLFQDLAVRIGGEVVPLAGRSERLVLIALALSSGRSLTRRELVSLTWPDVEFSVGGNRLRTALVALRRFIHHPDAITSDGDKLGLNERLFSFDIDAAAQLSKMARLSQDVFEERRVHQSLVAMIGSGLLPGYREKWIEQRRDEWAFQRASSLLRLSEIDYEEEEFGSAIASAELVIADFPSDEVAWSIYLKSMGKLGFGAEAYRKFNATKRKLEAGELSAGVVELAKSTRSMVQLPVGLPKLPAGLEGTLVHSFQRLTDQDPKLVAGIVTSDAFRLEILRNPGPPLEFLERLASKLEDRSPEHVAVMLMAMRTHSLLHGVEPVRTIGRWLLECSLAPLQRRMVLSVLSFSYFLTREFDIANTLIDEAIEVAEKEGLPHHRALNRVDKAQIGWHQGESVAARKVFVKVFEEINEMPEAWVSYAPALVGSFVGTIDAMEGRFKSAVEWLSRADSESKVKGYREQLLMIEPVLGYVLVQLDRPKEGFVMLVSGLARCNRSGNHLAFEVGVDFAAAAFAVAGRCPTAVALLEWGARSRKESRQVRSVVEQAFAEQTRTLCKGVTPDPKLGSSESPQALLRLIYDRTE